MQNAQAWEPSPPFDFERAYDDLAQAILGVVPSDVPFRRIHKTLLAVAKTYRTRTGEGS